MIRNPGGLLPEVLALAKEHVRLVESSPLGVGLLIYCTFRTPEEQAVLYGKGRSPGQVQDKIQKLESQGFYASARLLREHAVSSSGRPKTNAPPYFSYHQFRLAYDCVPVLHGKLIWETTGKDLDIWNEVGRLGELVGLEWAGRWLSFKETAHFQLVPDGFNLEEEARKVP